MSWRSTPTKSSSSLLLSRARTTTRFYIDTALQQPTAHLGEIPHLQGMENGLRAIRSLLWYGQFQRERAKRVGEVSRKRGNEEAGTPANDKKNAAQQARAIIKSSGGRALTEAEGKAVLSLYGIPVTREATATSAVEAAQQARDRLPGRS